MKNKLKVGDSFEVMSWYQPVIQPLIISDVHCGIQYAQPLLHTVVDYGKWRIPLHAFKAGKITITKLK